MLKLSFDVSARVFPARIKSCGQGPKAGMNPLMDSQYEEVMERGVRQEVGSTDCGRGSLRGVSGPSSFLHFLFLASSSVM